MADPVKRLHYFDKQFLREQDFIDEQNYQIQRHRDHNRLLHTPGIAQGLEIPDPPAGSTRVTVNAGIAYDKQGRQIVLANNQEINLESFAADQSIYLAIAYAEKETDPSSEAGVTGNTRWTEEPLLEALLPTESDQFPEDPEEKIILGKANRSGNQIGTIDRTERRIAGVVGGDLEVRSVTFSNPTVVSDQWSRLNLSAARQVDMEGSLSIDGNLNVTGTIQGNLADSIVGTVELTNNAVINEKIANGAVNSLKLSNNAVATEKIQNGAVTNEKIADNAVTAAKLANNTINKSKFDGSTRQQLDTALPNTGGNITGNLTINASNNVAAVRGITSGSSGILYSGYFTATGSNSRNVAVYGSASGQGTKYGGWFQAVNTNNSTAYGVWSEVAGNENGSKFGLYGRALGGTTGNRTGVYGYASANGTDSKYGLFGFASGSEGTKYGVYGLVSGSGTKYAGYFAGNVRVTGTLTKGGGSFLIDHPLEPLNKTLRHNFVESPEDLCLYRGKVKLNAEGSATVKMPDYFAALTQEEEATVNLTPIGKKPFLVSYEWSPGCTEFEVFGEPNAEVAYLVLADRDDPAIHQLRKPVEEEKGNGNFEQGKLLYPEAYGYPKEMGVDCYEEELVTTEKCQQATVI